MRTRARLTVVEVRVAMMKRAIMFLDLSRLRSRAAALMTGNSLVGVCLRSWSSNGYLATPPLLPLPLPPTTDDMAASSCPMDAWREERIRLAVADDSTDPAPSSSPPYADDEEGGRGGGSAPATPPPALVRPPTLLL